MLSCKLVQLDYFTPSVYKLWRIPPHPQPSIKCSLLPLRYGGASYSSPGRKPQSVGGKNSLLHPLSFLLLPPSKGGGRGRDILNLLDATIHRVSFPKTHKNKRQDFRLKLCANFTNACSSKHNIWEDYMVGPFQLFQLFGDNLLTNKFIKKNRVSWEKQLRNKLIKLIQLDTEKNIA